LFDFCEIVVGKIIFEEAVRRRNVVRSDIPACSGLVNIDVPRDIGNKDGLASLYQQT